MNMNEGEHQVVPESNHGPGAREREKTGKFMLTYPDGTTDTASNYEELMGKMELWRSEHRHS